MFLEKDPLQRLKFLSLHLFFFVKMNNKSKNDTWPQTPFLSFSPPCPFPSFFFFLKDSEFFNAYTENQDGSFLHLARGASGKVLNSSFRNGTSSVAGGAIIIESGSFEMQGGQVTSCYSSRVGAALHFLGETSAKVSEVSFNFNHAYQGGAMSFSKVFSPTILLLLLLLLLLLFFSFFSSSPSSLLLLLLLSFCTLLTINFDCRCSLRMF